MTLIDDAIFNTVKINGRSKSKGHVSSQQHVATHRPVSSPWVPPAKNSNAKIKSEAKPLRQSSLQKRGAKCASITSEHAPHASNSGQKPDGDGHQLTDIQVQHAVPDHLRDSGKHEARGLMKSDISSLHASKTRPKSAQSIPARMRTKTIFTSPESTSVPTRESAKTLACTETTYISSRRQSVRRKAESVNNQCLNDIHSHDVIDALISKNVDVQHDRDIHFGSDINESVSGLKTDGFHTENAGDAIPSDGARLVQKPIVSTPRRKVKRTKAGPQPSESPSSSLLSIDALTLRDNHHKCGISVRDPSACDDQLNTVSDASIQENIDALPTRDNQDLVGINDTGDRDHFLGISQNVNVPSPVIQSIQYNWRLRQRWHKAEKSLVLQAKALLRSLCNGDKEQATAIYDLAYAPFAKKKQPAGYDAFALCIDAVGIERAFALMPILTSIVTIERQIEGIEKQLIRDAKTLPVHAWTAQVGGFGALTLASIVGEAGDIGSYKSVSALWKRMGLAVIGDKRQQRVTGDEALLHGYSPPRRAVAYLLGQWMIMAGDKNPYRSVYQDRKSYELERCQTIADDPDILKKYSRSGKYAPKSHADKRAARYMVKRVLRDLYSAWRALERDEPMRPPGQLPLETLDNIAERAQPIPCDESIIDPNADVNHSTGVDNA